MSQTANRSTSSPRQPTTPTAKRALRFFERVIWHDHRVCSECFTLMKGRFAGQFETPSGKLVEIDHTWRTPAATLGEAHEEPPESVASVIPIARARTTCEECGSVRGLRQSDTLTAREALDRVPALIDRLEEAGFEVDEDVVYGAVRHLKTESDLTSNDKHVFATAAYHGVDDATL